jgi:hypothetical protein
MSERGLALWLLAILLAMLLVLSGFFERMYA